jgi:hypothetical protein
MRRLPPSLLACLCAALPASSAPAPVEDPAARAALPEFKYIPAAKPETLAPATPVDAAIFRGWPRSQGDNGSRRYSALSQITRANVRSLEIAWTYRSGDGAANLQCTPIVVDGLLYAPTPGKALVALDATTGAERWRRQLPVAKIHPPARIPPPAAASCTGPATATTRPRLLFGAGDWIYAADPKTGEPIAGFGEGRPHRHPHRRHGQRRRFRTCLRHLRPAR